MFAIRGQIVLPSIAQNYWQLFTLEPTISSSTLFPRHCLASAVHYVPMTDLGRLSGWASMSTLCCDLGVHFYFPQSILSLRGHANGIPIFSTTFILDGQFLSTSMLVLLFESFYTRIFTDHYCCPPIPLLSHLPLPPRAPRVAKNLADSASAKNRRREKKQNI